MSILIKGMDMPKSCKDCPLLGTALNCRILEVAVDGDYYNPDARHEDCPLVKLPPHGDLIDRDALNNAFTGMRFNADGLLLHYGDREDWYLKGSEVETLITNATTIIESEGGNE